ncbi:MAG: DUF4157 domain-containing protein [Pseudonocardiaceae bacterium]
MKILAHKQSQSQDRASSGLVRPNMTVSEPSRDTDHTQYLRTVGNQAALRLLQPVRPIDVVSAAPSGLHPTLALGAIHDPLEREADALADRTTRPTAASEPPPSPGSPHSGGRTAVPEGAVAQLRALRGSGNPLQARDRGYYGLCFGHDFSQVRVHSGARADRVTEAFRARALTVGNDIVLGSDVALDGGATGRHSLAHELAHVVQQRRAYPAREWIQRLPAPNPPNLKAGDDITIAVYSLTTDATPEPRYSRSYHIGANGAIVIEDGRNTVPIDLAGRSPHDAAQRIADRLVEAELFRGPRVCVTGPGMTAPTCADAKTAMRPDIATAYANFIAYIRTTKEPADAVSRYYQWISEHRDSPEFTQISPPDLWTQSLRPPPRPKDPEAERTEHWIRFMKDRLAENAKLPEKERVLAAQTMLQFQNWFDKHHGDPDFAKADPAKVYADISVGLLKQSIEASARRKIEADKQAAATSPAALKATAAKFDEFVALGMKLWGYSARTFPYSIPLDSQGKDILVTGDPALQNVLNALAGDLIRWATAHMSDSNYATVSAKRVLLDLLQGGYSNKIVDAQSEPLAHETIDRNEILAKNALIAFGETVATGLFVVAAVGLFVGANVITAGQATWIFVGLAGYSGIQSYTARRDEIERSGYSVPVAETMLHSAGDVIGVSQLVESFTGQRLGTNAPMGSEARSTQLGAGAGAGATLLVGSRAYRTGQGIGQSARLARRGLTPPGPDVHLPSRPVPPRPAVPAPNPAMGPVETAAHAALPERLRPGLDLWSGEIRQNGGNPETVFGKMKPEKLQSQAEVFLKRYEAAVAEVDRAAHQAARATDDPLHPQLKNVEVIRGTKVTLHYERTPPGNHEISQAVELSRRTGEEIHLFGDNASGHNYPGIDGTIGSPPRPLSLKNAVPEAHPNLARKMADDARQAAKDAGYTHVEVHINMPGSKVADIKAAWDSKPPLPTDPLPGPAFEGSVVAKIVIQAAEGQTWTLTPPLTGPPRTGVTPVPPRPEREDKK